MRQTKNHTSGVRDAAPGDLAGVVDVHQKAFRGFFLDRMGRRFLRAYYACILEYEASVFLVSEDDAQAIDGFAVGFRDPGAFYDFFRSRRLRLAPIILAALLRRPTLFVEIARNTRRVATPERGGGEATVELSSIGTSRLGAGVGSALLRAFCERSRLLGATEVALTTDRDDNEPVIRFYIAHGFKKNGTEGRGGRVLERMVLSLSPAR